MVPAFIEQLMGVPSPCPFRGGVRWACPGCSDSSSFSFSHFVVLEFRFWLFEPVPAPSGVSHSSLPHLWGLTVVLPAPFGMAHLNTLGGYCRDRCSLAVHRVLSVSRVKQGGKGLLSGFIQLSS